MNKWLQKFMEKPDNTDISDRLDGNLEKRPGEGPDKPDRLDPSLNLSGLSGRPRGLLEENLEKMENPSATKPDISDKTDKPDITDKTNSRNYLSDFSRDSSGNMPFSFSNGSRILDEYEERLSIAEYDGHQYSIQAQRIAYLDAFMAVLATLPHEDAAEDWLSQSVKAAQVWLHEQGMVQPR